MRQNREGFCEHNRDTAVRLTEYNTSGSVLKFGGCEINVRTFKQWLWIYVAVRVLGQINYVSLSPVEYWNMSEDRGFNYGTV